LLQFLFLRSTFFLSTPRFTVPEVGQVSYLFDINKSEQILTQKRSLSILNIRREEIRALWDRIKAKYDECTGCIAEAGDSAADSLSILKAKYGYCYSVYVRCGAQIADMIAQAPQVQAVPTQTYISSGCRLPPCDTEVFIGDYLRWPNVSPKCQNKRRCTHYSVEPPPLLTTAFAQLGLTLLSVSKTSGC